MALIHPQSCECINSQIDFFSIPPTNTSIIDGQFEQYHPISTLTDGSPIEFSISGAGTEYLDLAHSYINIKAQIVTADGSVVPPDKDVGPVNLLLHSLFSQVDVSLNGKLVTPSTNTYAYRSYLETLLNYDLGAKTSHLTGSMWFKDTAHQFESINDANLGFKTRRDITKQSAIVDLVGKIFSDIFFVDKYILNGIDVKIRMVRSKDSFCLMSGENDAAYKVVIKEASLYARKVKLDPSVDLSIIKALNKGNAKYPINRTEIKIYSIPQGSLSNSQQNLILGQLPNKLVVGFVETTALNGNYKKNPYNFQHFGITFMAININGKRYPSKPYTPNFANNQYARSYLSLFMGTSQAFQDTGNDISFQDFKGGNTLYCFDFTPDIINGPEFELIKTGNVSLEVNFSQALASTINCVCLFERNNLIEIDRTKNVIGDFSA